MGGLSITGYVLEPPRVGQANSPYTSTPNVYIYDQGVFDGWYDSLETKPRTEYCVFVKTDGDMHSADFIWTKNEVIQRFDYDGLEQRFRSLYGAVRDELGDLDGGGGALQLQATPPLSADLANYPLRLAVGTAGSGLNFPVTVVATDGGFGTPGLGTVELSQSTGNIKWNPTDVVNYAGQPALFQRQSCYTSEESSGRLGLVDDALLLLNPIPATGQFPLIRIGFNLFLTPVEVPDEGSFTAPGTLPLGTVEWALDTGRLNFSTADITLASGTPVYHEGAAFGFGSTVYQAVVGTVSAPSALGAGLPEVSDIYFRIVGVIQFPLTRFVDAFSALGKRGEVEIRRSDGQIQFSYVDQLLYGPQTVRIVICDLTMERGMKLRMFRTPVDLAGTDDTLKDVSAFYTVGTPSSIPSATWADPIIQSPQVSLPAVPSEGFPITIRVEQGTGSFTGDLNRLDVASPLVGLGYVIDYEARQLKYARYRTDVLTEQSAQVPYSAVALDDPLIFESNLVLELEDGPWAPLTLGQDALINYTGGLVTLTSTSGALPLGPVEGTGEFSGTLFTDTSKGFTAAGVTQNDLLVVPSGPSAGVYTVDAPGTTSLTTDLPGGIESNVPYEIRRGGEILADRFFNDVASLDPNTRIERLESLGTTTNGPRLLIPVADIDTATTRFRFGKTSAMLSFTTVVNDGAFTTPASMAQGDIEVSLDSGNINFSQADVTTAEDVYLARTLTLGADYRIQAGLGFIELTERMLEQGELFVTYAVFDDDGNKVIVEERGAFIVRKELHNTLAPSSVIPFNPLGREVADLPAPQAFRGGRPQVNDEQVSFDATASTCTFLADNQVTDALPSGALVDPSEDIMIDYYVHGAIGGEKSFTVLQPPMVGVQVTVTTNETSFTIAGDRTADFQFNHLLRVDREEVYLLSSPSYDAGSDLTTVNLVGPQVFRSDFTNPALAVSSGPTRVNSIFLLPAYFATEPAAYDTIPRGGNRFRLTGDRSADYVQNTIVHFTDGGSVFEFNRVEGSVYNTDTLKTEVVLSSNGVRQYTPGTVILKRSVRPILAEATAAVATSLSLIDTEPYTVYRRIEGQVGQILAEPAGYKIDPTGRIEFTDPLQDNEELGIFYTGGLVIDDGRDFRATYVHLVAPSQSNGLQNQVLKADFTTYVPDSFYWRVETMTNFRGELAEQYEDEAKAAVPTGGPILENASQPALYEQGRESVFYQEGRLANEDEVARATLKYYNDGVNLLEDALQDMDGRVVGDHDGRFLFDGEIDNTNRDLFSQVTNQIDDTLKVADPPAQITFSPFALIWLGTFQEVYKPASFSRFFPTKRDLYSMTADPTGLQTGDTILDTGVKPLAKVSQVSRRLPWAVVTRDEAIGAVTLHVDNADGEENLYRPSFSTANMPMSVVIQAQDGTVIFDDFISPAVITAKPSSLTLTLSVPLTVPVPQGATVRAAIVELGAPGTPYLKHYRPNFDVGVNLQEGVLTHVVPYPPFDGTFPAVPVELELQNPGKGEILDVFSDLNATTTDPDRPPAFDGGTEDDDGNRQFPILTPWLESEDGDGVGYIDTEVTASVNIQLVTTAPFVGTGDLNAGATIITNQGGNWAASPPIPEIYDLVTINDGLNGPSSFHRITAVGASDITVTPAFGVQDLGFSFTVTTSASLVTSAIARVFTTTTVTDPVIDFVVAQVKPGHTVVVTAGPFAGLRRQVTTVTTNVLTFEPALPGGTTATYRVDKSLSTFGGTNSYLDDDLVPALDGELAVLGTNGVPLWSERDALERFLEHVFTNVLTSSNGETASGSVLTDSTVNFVAAGVGTGDTKYVYIRSGTSAGIYEVDPGAVTVNTLGITGTFTGTGVGLSYRIVESLGATIVTLESVYDALAGVDNAIIDVTTFRSLVTTPVAVSSDASAFARRTTLTDLNNRLGVIVIRRAELNDPTGDIANIEAALSSGDRFYDRRFVWIDTRINLENGILPKKDRAAQERARQQAEIVKQLTKLLTTRP